MKKSDIAADPRGLLYEAYRMTGIGAADCRTIFLDWMLGLPAEADQAAALQSALDHYTHAHPDHPMTAVLRENHTPKGLGRRRGGRSGRN
ncbi:MAG: hypothetical protein AAGE76_16655 [Pseudomonadota bacterium]